MKLSFHGHDEKYAVEQSMLSLFPGEKPVYSPIQPGEDNWAEVTLHETADRCQAQVALCRGGKTARQTLDAPLSGDDFQREGIRRRAIGRCFFLAARQVLDRDPPWGMLTGVRPVKLPTRFLKAGQREEQVRDTLIRDYYISPRRTDLAMDCAKASLAVGKDLRDDQVSLYIGIPFCPTRCAYCSFVSADVHKALKLVPSYVEALLGELDATGQALSKAGLTIHSLYMGGGTPTTLSAEHLDQVLTRAEQVLPLDRCIEYTVEAGRPDTITMDKLNVLSRHGIGRISINPQTLEDHVLAAIGRKHDAGAIFDAFAMARAVGFDCINADLIAGLPRDSEEGFRRSLDGMLELGAENITVHTLALKKGSALMTRDQGGTLPPGDEVARMLDYSLDTLRGAGYAPYYLYRQKYMSGALENVGWALPGKESVYNIVMMEELQSVISAGGGGVTKLVDPKTGRILRLPNPKYPHDYMELYPKVLSQKEDILDFYRG